MDQNISYSEQVYQKIKDRIIDQTYPAGMALTEMGLAEEFGVSKTPVKAAVDRLINENWLESGFRKKVYVKDFTEKQINEYYELRRIMESAAIDKIFDTGKNWEFSFKLETCIVAMRAAINDYFKFESADAKLHRTLISVFENERIEQLYDSLNDELVRINVLIYKYNIKTYVGYFDSIIDELEHFVLAIREEDKATAKKYMLDIHMQRGYNEAIQAHSLDHSNKDDKK